MHVISESKKKNDLSVVNEMNKFVYNLFLYQSEQKNYLNTKNKALTMATLKWDLKMK